MARKNAQIDLEALTDDALITLIVSARKEAQRRGIEAEAEVWAGALGDDEATRIARAAAERETVRLRDEQARTIAQQAAEKVRREAEAAKVKAEADKQAAHNARLGAIAAEARALFGSDVAEFNVKVWQKPGDKRVYIGKGYGANWVCYYHDGTSKIAPGTLEVEATGAVTDLATHHGESQDAARERMKAFAAGLCREWSTLSLDVTESNAPRDPASFVEGKFYIKAHDGFYAARQGDGSWAGTKLMAEATAFETRDEASAAIPDAASNERYFGERYRPAVVQFTQWRAFPPKEV